MGAEGGHRNDLPQNESNFGLGDRKKACARRRAQLQTQRLQCIAFCHDQKLGFNPNERARPQTKIKTVFANNLLKLFLLHASCLISESVRACCFVGFCFGGGGGASLP